MAPKREYVKWGKIFAYIGGILYIVGGVIALLDIIIPGYTMSALTSDLIVQSSFIIRSFYLWLFVLISILLGSLTLILVNTNLNELVLGIILVIFAIVGLGIPGIFIIISGVLYIIASTKRR